MGLCYKASNSPAGITFKQCPPNAFYCCLMLAIILIVIINIVIVYNVFTRVPLPL